MSALSGFSLPMPREPRPRPHANSRLARLVGRITIALWVPVVLAMCAYLLGGHLLSLPSPTRESAQLGRAMGALGANDEAHRWVVLHVLFEECRCSARVLDRLVARGADASMNERIVLVATSTREESAGAHAARAEAAGFRVERVSADELVARYGIQSAPLLAVSDAAGALRYVGGYTDRKQSPVVRDREIVRALRSGTDVPALPIFGCPVSKALDEAVDPFGLRR